MTDAPLTIGMVAGEASGDLLGSHFIKALRGHLPQARFVGIGGPRMQSVRPQPSSVVPEHHAANEREAGNREALAKTPQAGNCDQPAPKPHSPDSYLLNR